MRKQNTRIVVQRLRKITGATVLFPDLEEGAVHLRRNDPDESLGCFSPHSFELEGKQWPSVEHYFQAMKFESTDPAYSERIRNAETPSQARKLGRKNKKQLRGDWSQVKRIVMTRGLYIKCRSHDDIAAALLATGESKIIENSQYDYYWGCGRDRRGDNIYGEILMDVRRKLREEASTR